MWPEYGPMKLDCYLVSIVYEDDHECVLAFSSDDRDAALATAQNEWSDRALLAAEPAWRIHRVTVYHVTSGMIVKNFGSGSP